jgi:hypothetical protein
MDEFPRRIIFFCDCNAKFDSALALKAHGAGCPEVRPIVAGGHYPTRDGIITIAEEVMKNFFAVMPETISFSLLIGQLTKVEFLRRQGKAPTDGKAMHDLLTSADTPYTREQGVELMEEVAGWFGIGRAEIAQFMK